MAAWKHTRYWSGGPFYELYRRFARAEGPGYEGQPEDCANISILLLVEFAAQQGLALTFTGPDGTLYCSKATERHPSDARWLQDYSWGDKDAFIQVVRAQIGSKTLVERNTLVNPVGPQAGDLMLQAGHTALVLDWYAPGRTHRRAADTTSGVSSLFPGPDEAKKPLNQMRSFRADSRDDPGRSDPKGRFDYLNYRGMGVDDQPIKQKAELTYNASVTELEGSGVEFRKYDVGVLDDWSDWDGTGAPPRRQAK